MLWEMMDVLDLLTVEEHTARGLVRSQPLLVAHEVTYVFRSLEYLLLIPNKSMHASYQSVRLASDDDRTGSSEQGSLA